MNSRALNSCSSVWRSRLLGVFDLPDVVLRIELDAQLLHQVKLRFQEVDVMLLVLHQLFEQVAGHVVARAMAMSRRLLVKRARRNLGLEIAIEDLFHVLTDVQRI